MLYYPWYFDHGRAVLASDLGTDDPFGLAPGDIVDAVVQAGYTPAAERPQSEPFRSLGTVTEVEREGLTYFVSVSRDAEEIGVQERREEAYDPVE